MNPELRQTLNTISRNLETANETAQENIFTFTQAVIDPCLNGLKSCLADCTTACFPTREDRLRRRRARSRGASDYHFDFYDDWEDDEDTTYGASNWGNDELDSLLAGRSPRSGQPGRQRAMSYGARGRKGHAQTEDDPNIIPSSSRFGFLERFSWRLGAKGLRYKPSAADLQENPGRLRTRDMESESLLESEEEQRWRSTGHSKKHRRQRSDTEGSRSTTNSLSSRGDLIVGDEEEDAIPIDEEFAVMLSRRTTEDSNKRPRLSRGPTRTVSSRSVKSNRSKKSRDSGGRQSAESLDPASIMEHSESQPPTMAELYQQESEARREEEMEIAQKREAAAQLAKTRGLEVDTKSSVSNVETKTVEAESNALHTFVEEAHPTVRAVPADNVQQMPLASPLSSNIGYHADSETEPFPSMPTTPLKDRDEYLDPP